MSSWTFRRLCGVTLVSLLLLAAWDLSGLDVPLAHLVGNPHGFPLRSQHAFVLVMHEFPRTLSSLLVLGLLVGIVRPWSFLQRLTRAERAQLALSVVGAMLLVTAFKKMNSTSCPWDLAEFGGSARYVSHWLWGVHDGGPGHCFPAGHASSAFGFLAGWFVIRRAAPDLSHRWLLLSLAFGLFLGLGQQLRGAHYMSHTLWTAFTCWTFGLLLDAALALRARHRVAASSHSPITAVSAASVSRPELS